MKGMQRSTKFYFKNEKEVMEDLGLKAVPGSGSQWTHKEDGENDYVLAQLKSTDKQSYKLNKLDLEKLEYHSMVAHKVPLFILQFLNDDSRYAIIKIEDIPKLNEYINTGQVKNVSEGLIFNPEDIEETKPKRPKRKIKSSASARELFYKQKEEEWENKRWSR